MKMKSSFAVTLTRDIGEKRNACPSSFSEVNEIARDGFVFNGEKANAKPMVPMLNEDGKKKTTNSK